MMMMMGKSHDFDAFSHHHAKEDQQQSKKEEKRRAHT
jgi:hypothetical protein